MKTKHDITKSMLSKIRIIERNEEDIDIKSDDIDVKSKKEDDVEKKRDENFRKFLVNGILVQLSGIDATELEFTENEKEGVKTSMQAFIDNITDLVEFKILNISSSNIEWVGELTQENIEWVYSLDDQNGCYISGDMIQMTDETITIIGELKQNYKEWSSIWGRILSERKTERRKKLGKKKEL